VTSRRDEIATNLRAVRARMGRAAVLAGRDPAELTLIVVTKTFPTEDLRLLHELGVRDVGENRHPEAGEKAAELRDLEMTWHFVGRLQSNKAAAVASYADVVHSVDSTRVAARLGAGAHRHHRVVRTLVQVSLDPAGSAGRRGGVDPDEVASLARTVAVTDGLELRGLMGIAPRGEAAAPALRRLGEIWGLVRRSYPTADVLSAGMSEDFPDAIAAGATHVRVGSAVLGSRPALR